MPDYTRTGQKISGNRSYGVNESKFVIFGSKMWIWVPTAICKTWWKLCCGLGPIQPMVLRKVSSNFDPSWSHLIINNFFHTVNAVQVYLNRHTHKMCMATGLTERLSQSEIFPINCQKRATTISLWSTMEALSWFEASFQPAVLEILSKLIKTPQITARFWSTVWKASDWQKLNFSLWQCPMIPYSASTVKA